MPGGSGEQQRPYYIIQEHARLMNGIKPLGDTSWFEGLMGAWVEGTDYPNWTNNYDGDPSRTWNVRDQVYEAHSLNPFTGVAAYDPDPALTEVEGHLQDWEDLVTDIDPTDALAAAVDAALEAVADTAIDEATITAAVDAFEARGEESYQKALSGRLVTLLTGRAVMSDGFDGVTAYMANQRQREINDFDAKIRLMSQDSRQKFSIGFAEMFVNLLQFQHTAHQSFVGYAAELAKLRITGMQDQIATDLAYDDKEVRWKLDLNDYMNHTLGATVGSFGWPKESTKLERAMAGLGNSITTGIGVGTALGNPGAGVAVGLGGAALSILTALVS